jgi:O-antigen ligase
LQPRDPAAGPLATIEFVLYCVFLLSGLANDWSLRLFGSKAYLSVITLVLLPIVWLLSGNAGRGLHHRIGLWWVAFLVWIILASPFSVWKGGSAALLANYVPRAYLCFFYACSFVTTLRRCRQLMYINIAGAAILVATCLAYGGMDDTAGEARFRIPQSLFFANANDLALALLLGIAGFLFLFYRPGIVSRLAGAAGVVLCSLYLFKTGSRGGLVAAAAMLALIFILSRSKWKVAAVALPVLGLVLAVSPTAGFHRLSLVINDPKTSPYQSSSDWSSVDSQVQRQEVFKKSLYYTIAHPLLGVGPDQFAVAVDQETERTGQHVAWLGTHNAYTQVSSECGVPALIFYVAVIGLCLRTNFRRHRQTRDIPALRDAAGLSLCLLAGTLVYAVSALFFHIAYSAHLPLLAGATAALELAAGPKRAPAAQEKSLTAATTT